MMFSIYEGNATRMNRNEGSSTNHELGDYTVVGQ